MWLSLLSLLSTSANACETVQAQYIHVLPEVGSMEVPVDSIITIELGYGSLIEQPEVILSRGDKPLLVDVDVYRRGVSPHEEHIILEVIPVEELAPGEGYSVAISDPEWGDVLNITSFEVVERRSEPMTSVPEIRFVQDEFWDFFGAEEDECTIQTQTDLYFELGGEVSAANHSINIYRVDAALLSAGRNISEEQLNDRFYTVMKAEEAMFFQTSVFNGAADEEYCFVARYSNEAGQEGPISKAVCSLEYGYPLGKCGTVGPLGGLGCSNIGASTSGMLAMFMSVFGLVRRRKNR